MPGLKAAKRYGPAPIGRFLESLHADLLHVLLRHDPGRAGRGGGVEGHEIGPGLLEDEAHAQGVDHLDAGDLGLEQPGGGPAVALERELHVLRRHRLAVVELHALAEHELIGEPVLGCGPGLGEARGHGVAGHRLHERVVQRVEDHEGRDDARRLGGVEPRGGERHVNRPGGLALRGGRGRGKAGDEEDGGDQRDGEAGSERSHRRRTS